MMIFFKLPTYLRSFSMKKIFLLRGESILNWELRTGDCLVTLEDERN